MTMLAMWLGEATVALATDGKMGNKPDPAPKLHVVKPNKVMFGIGFGKGCHKWLSTKCPCPKEHPYPEHWRDCSGAANTTAIEAIMCKDIQERECPVGCELQLWVAGINACGDLEAFILSKSGRRIHKMTPNTVKFNETIKCESKRLKMPWEPEQLFTITKEEMAGRFRYSGSKALIDTCRRLVSYCEEFKSPKIGGPFQCYMIVR